MCVPETIHGYQAKDGVRLFANIYMATVKSSRGWDELTILLKHPVQGWEFHGHVRRIRRGPGKGSYNANLWGENGITINATFPTKAVAEEFLARAAQDYLK